MENMSTSFAPRTRSTSRGECGICLSVSEDELLTRFQTIGKARETGDTMTGLLDTLHSIGSGVFWEDYGLCTC